jgi:hypothetical protein
VFPAHIQFSPPPQPVIAPSPGSTCASTVACLRPTHGRLSIVHLIHPSSLLPSLEHAPSSYSSSVAPAPAHLPPLHPQRRLLHLTFFFLGIPCFRIWSSCSFSASAPPPPAPRLVHQRPRRLLQLLIDFRCRRSTCCCSPSSSSAFPAPPPAHIVRPAP